MKSSVQTLLSAGSMSGTLTSTAFRLSRMDRAAIQAVFTGTPNGTFKLQASCDAGADPGTGPATFGVTNWTDITGSSAPITASGDYLWNLTAVGFRWVRLVYTFSSGTGVLGVVASAKGTE